MNELGAVPDHAAPLEVSTGFEAGRVDEGHDGQVEVVAPGDESSRLARCLDVDRPGAVRGLVCDHADRGHPAPAVVHETPAQLGPGYRLTGEVGDGIGTGHEGERVVGHHDLVE